MNIKLYSFINGLNKIYLDKKKSDQSLNFKKENIVLLSKYTIS